MGVVGRRRWVRKAASAAVGLAVVVAGAVAPGPARAGLPGGAQAAAAGEPTRGPLRLELVAEAEVSGPVIRLEDVARPVDGDGERWAGLRSTPVGAAPLPGEERVLPLASILAGLRRAGVDLRTLEWVEGRALVVVRRQAATLEAEAVRDAIARYLQSRAPAGGGLAGQAEPASPLTVSSLVWDAPVRVGVGPVTAEVVAAPPLLRPGPAVFSVEVRTPGTAPRRIWVRTTLEGPIRGEPPGTVPGSAVAGGAGHPEARAEAGGPVRGEPAAGPGGEPVAAGTPVLLVATRGSLSVSVPAVVRSGGRVGSVVEVVNGLSGQVVAALLLSSDRAVAVGPVQPSGGEDR